MILCNSIPAVLFLSEAHPLQNFVLTIEEVG